MTLYLSFAAADRDRALELVAGLRSAGHTVRADNQLSGDSGWWSSILAAVSDADAFLYATSTDATASPAVAAQRDYAFSRGLPVMAVHLPPPRGSTGPAPGDGRQTARSEGRQRGWPREAVVDFTKADASAAFGLVGAIAALSPRGRAVGWGPPPASPFALVEGLAEAARAAMIPRDEQIALVDRLRDAAADERTKAAAQELASILRLHAGLDAEAVTRLDEAFPRTSTVASHAGAGYAMAARPDRPEPAVDRPDREVADGAALSVEAVRGVGFHKPSTSWRGYDERGVDEFLDVVEQDLRARQDARSAADAAGGPVSVKLTPADVRAVRFARPPFGRRGYDQDEVDSFLHEVERSFTLLDAELGRRGATVAKL